MKLTIQFLEQNLDRFERIYAEKYAERKGYKHDFIYFTVEHKFTSDGNELFFEACVIFCKIDHDKTTEEFKIMVVGSFDTLFVYKAQTEEALISKMIKLIEEHEAIS
jgi:hypothetical protein